MTDEIDEIEVHEESSPSEEAAEVEQSTDTEAEAAESAESGKEGPGSEDSEKSEESDRTQQRFNELTAQKYQLRDENKKLADELAQLRQKLGETVQKPRLDDPEINHDPEKFEAALLNWHKSQQQPAAAEPAVDPVKIQKVESFGQKLREFEATVPDYQEKVAKMPVSDDTSDAILEMENGPQVAYYLATHLDVLDSLEGLTPVTKALKIQELSQKLQPAQPLLTEAPPPVESVAGQGGEIAKDRDKMSVAELDAFEERKFRQAQGR